MPCSSSPGLQEHNTWEPASGARLSSCWSIDGGFPPDDGLTSIVAGVGKLQVTPPRGKPGVVDAEARPSHQGKDATTPPRPMSPMLASANVGATTLGDAAIVATTDGVNRTPLP